MSDHLSVLIVGGYGTFGGRIVALLEDEPRLELIVAGRSVEKAARYCQSRLGPAAALTPAAFDRAGDLAAQLQQLRPDILVDASGPFQAYGGDSYRLVAACIRHGVDYLDLADGSAFVAGVAAFDAARAAGRLCFRGVSTFRSDAAWSSAWRGICPAWRRSERHCTVTLRGGRDERDPGIAGYAGSQSN